MKNIKNIIYIFLVLLWGGACDLVQPLDELEPKYKLTEETAYTDSAKVEAALNGIYAGWRKAGSGSLPGDIMSLSGNMSYLFGTEYNTNLVQSDNYANENAYSGYYVLIQRASFLIDNLKGENSIQSLSDKRRLEIEAEARISRAMCHFELLQLYGQFYDLSSNYGIVIRMEASRNPESVQRNTVQEVYDAILEDLDFAITNAPVINVHHKFSQTLAKALKAKVLLYMGDFTNAATIALDAMGDTNYALESTYGAIFSQGYRSREILFAPLSIAWTEYLVVVTNWNYTPLNIKTIADNEVPGPGNDFTGVGYDTRYAYTFVEGLVTGTPNQKYQFRPFTEGEQGNTLIRMRMAEVYLIYAEARARSSSGIDAEAVAKLNDIRLRVNMPVKAPATKAELLEAIRIEKNLELFAEMGQPWFDMIRYHKYGDINISDIKSTITSDNQLILPIPRAALESNSLLIQNPGYN